MGSVVVTVEYCNIMVVLPVILDFSPSIFLYSLYLRTGVDGIVSFGVEGPELILDTDAEPAFSLALRDALRVSTLLRPRVSERLAFILALEDVRAGCDWSCKFVC
jgi:hypothetical protein